MAVLYSLKPIKYIGPIMVAGCNQHHYEFIHSPVPMLLGLWGNDHLLDKCRVKIGELINKE